MKITHTSGRTERLAEAGNPRSALRHPKHFRVEPAELSGAYASRHEQQKHFWGGSLYFFAARTPPAPRVILSLTACREMIACTIALLASAFGAAPSRRYLVFANASDWEIAYDYYEDACPNINPRSQHRSDVSDSMPVAWSASAARVYLPTCESVGRRLPFCSRVYLGVSLDLVGSKDALLPAGSVLRLSSLSGLRAPLGRTGTTVGATHHR